MRTNRPGLVKSVSLLLLLMVMLAGCRKVALYHNLNEEEANEIIVVLYSAGIDAKKDKELVQNETFWNISVDKENLAEAQRLLVERSLPRKKEMGLSGVYKEKGLIPTPDEQKARFLLAIKGEIVNSLEKIPEVIDADVVINVPTPEEFGSDEEKRPTASVFLKVRPEENVVSQITESKIQQFVANTVEDLNPRDVSVIISYVTPPSPGTRPGGKLVLPEVVKKKAATKATGETVSIAGIEVSKDSASRLKIYLMVFFAILIILSAVLIVNVVRTTRMRQEYKALSEGGEQPLIEGEVAEAAPEQIEAPEDEEGEEL